MRPTFWMIVTVILLLATRQRFGIGISYVISGLFLAIVSSGIPSGLKTIVIAFTETVIEPSGYSLLIAVAFITMLGNIMRISGAMDELVPTIRLLVKDIRKLMFLMPSFGSLLAGPGAGVLPVPLVDSIGNEIGMSSERKALASLLFRHIWFAIYPVYTPFILLHETSGMAYSALLVPGLTCLIAVGLLAVYFVFGDTHAAKGTNHASTSEKACSDNASNILSVVRKLLLTSLPLIAVLTLRIGFNMSFPLSCGFGCLTALLPLSAGQSFFSEIKRRIIEGALPGLNWHVILTFAGIRFFSYVVINSGFVNTIAAILSGYSLSLILLSVGVPFIVGFVVGSHTAAIGLALPLLMPLLPGQAVDNSYLALLYLSSLMGYTTSPAHLCTIGAVQCLNADFRYVWYRVLIAGIAGLIICMLFGIYWLT
jgi:hypothetical protein